MQEWPSRNYSTENIEKYNRKYKENNIFSLNKSQ